MKFGHLEGKEKEMKIVWKLEGNYGMSKEFTRKSGNSFPSLTFNFVIDSRAIYIACRKFS